MVKRLILTALLISVLMVSTASAAVLLDQASFIWEDSGQPVGYSTVEFYQTETGYTYKSEHTLLIFFLDAVALQGVTEVGLDQDYAIVKYSDFTELGDTAESCEITVDYSKDAAVVTVAYTDFLNTITDTFQLEPGEKLYHVDTILYKLAAEGLVPGQEHQILLLETNEYQPVYGRIQIGEPGDYEIYDYQFEGNHALIDYAELAVDIYFDDQGKIHYTTSPTIPGFVERRADAVQELELSTFGVDLKTQAANLFIAHPVRSIYSQVLISGIDLDGVQLSDNRQRIVWQDADNSQALIEISRDNRSHRGKYQLPITDAEFAQYLGADRYIDPTLPEIQTLSAEILAGERDLWRAVERLVDWVFNYIDDMLTLMPKTTAQILADPIGDCNEYAILFAALARAAGIPTKVAEGYRYQDGYWAGHMWNEVWVGEWIAVDPSHRQTAPDALVVKLLDDSSVANIQVRHLGIFPYAELTIKQVDIFSKRASGILTTGVSGNTYTNADFAFSMSLPEGWSFVDTTDSSFTAMDQNQAANVIVEMYTLPPGIAPHYLVEAQAELLTELFSDYKVYGPESIETRVIAGQEAATANWGIEIEGFMIYQELIIFVVDDMCYNIALTIPALYYDHFKADLNYIIDSIVFH